MSALAQSIALAIQKQEGYGTPGATTINANNNPGALIAWPGYPTVNGFAQFPDYQTGFNAAVQNVQGKINQGMTLSQLTNAWAPAGASNDPTGINNPNAYATFVSSQTGLPTNIPLNSVTGGSADGTGLDLSAYTDTNSTDTSTVSLADSLGISSGGLIVLGIGALLLWMAL